MNALIVTWQGGGATQPAIGLGRLLAARGHRVRILAPDHFAGRVGQAGCRHRPFPRRAEFDPALGRRIEDQAEHFEGTCFGDVLPDAVAAEVTEEPADVVVVDYLLRSVLCMTERFAAARVVLMHMMWRFHAGRRGDPDAPWGWRWQYRVLVVMPAEFDLWPEPPASVVHVGPIVEEGGRPSWDPPWPSDDRRPLIVISMGTTYMGHAGVVERVAGALAGMDARVLVQTGHELAPGVSAVCLPLGRDQHVNAARTAELGAGVVLAADALPPAIRGAVEAAIAAPELHASAARLAAAVARYGDGERAVAELELL